MGRPRQRACLQDGLKLDLNYLFRQGWLRGGSKSGPFSIEWNNSYWGTVARGKLFSDLCAEWRGTVTIELNGLVQTVPMRSSPRHYGGQQWFFVCPSTGRSASVLWLPPGARRFCSRQAWGRQVAYRSQFLDATDRAHLGQAKIKARLIADLNPDEWDLPPKPKRMRWITYQRQEEKFDRYEASLNAGIAELVVKLGRKYC